MIVLAYALSPIDLIPDFISVVGYLDDVVLVPAGLVLFRRMIPAAVFEEHRLSAEVRLEERGKAAVAAAVDHRFGLDGVGCGCRGRNPSLTDQVHTNAASSSGPAPSAGEVDPSSTCRGGPSWRKLRVSSGCSMQQTPSDQFGAALEASLPNHDWSFS